MFLKRLYRRKTLNTMQIGENIRLIVPAMDGEDVRSPNDMTIEIGGEYLPAGVPRIVLKFSRLTGMKPSISIDAPREVAISHESYGGPLPDID